MSINGYDPFSAGQSGMDFSSTEPEGRTPCCELTLQKTGKTFSMEKQEFSMGSAPDSVDLHVGGSPANQVSPIHATVFQKNGGWFIKDNGTVFGTWLNGRKLEPTRNYYIPDNSTINLAGSEFITFKAGTVSSLQSSTSDTVTYSQPENRPAQENGITNSQDIPVNTPEAYSEPESPNNADGQVPEEVSPDISEKGTENALFQAAETEAPEPKQNDYKQYVLDFMTKSTGERLYCEEAAPLPELTEDTSIISEDNFTAEADVKPEDEFIPEASDTSEPESLPEAEAVPEITHEAEETNEPRIITEPEPALESEATAPRSDESELMGAIRHYKSSDVDDTQAMDRLISALTHSPLYFAVSLQAEQSSEDSSEPDIRLKLIESNMPNGAEFIPAYLSVEDFAPTARVNIAGLYPEDYLPILNSLNKIVMINPLKDETMLLSSIITDGLASRINGKASDE